MSECQWNRLGMDDKIVQILRDVSAHRDHHHFGTPYIGLYQIAAEFAERFPKEFHALGYPLGGKNTGTRYSLAGYIGSVLAMRIVRLRNKYPIEAVLTSRQNVLSMKFRGPGGTVVESSLEDAWDSPHFRLRDAV